MSADARPAAVPSRWIAAEVRKLASTRSAVALLAAPIAYPILMVSAMSVNDLTPPERDAIEVLRGTGDAMPVIWLLVGALAVAGEFHDGSIVSTLVAAPRRVGLFAAKLAALTVVALCVTAVAVTSALVLSAVAGPETWVDSVSTVDLARTVSAVLGISVAFAVVGGGVGAIVRHPTAAAIGILVWMLLVENAAPAALGFDEATRWVSSRSAAAVVDAARPEPGTIGASVGAAVLAALTAAVAGLGLVVFDRRDVEG